MSIAISACLDSDETTEISTDATVYAFGIDTIYGKYYPFTIDQLNRIIYNRDSMPVGSDTILDRILIDTFSVSGWITAGLNDTLFVVTDSVDLTPAINPTGMDGMKFWVHAPDGSTRREYTLKINKHTVEPDSLVWKEMEDVSPAFTNSIKAIALNGELLVYEANSSNVYTTSTRESDFGWTSKGLTGFPTDAMVETLIKTESGSDAYLYVATTDGKVYKSTDGLVWNEETTLGGKNVQGLIAGLDGTFTGIIEEIENTEEGTSKRVMVFYKNKSTDNGEEWDNSTRTAVPEEFPLANIHSSQFTTTNGIRQIVATGSPRSGSKLKQVPVWFSMNGIDWVDMALTAYDAYCPQMPDPVVMYYGDKFYIFGSTTPNKLDVIYSSIAGTAWHKETEKFLLPDEFASIPAHYSIAIDNDQFIWIVFQTGQIWRGRLNRLGFEIQ